MNKEQRNQAYVTPTDKELEKEMKDISNRMSRELNFLQQKNREVEELIQEMKVYKTFLEDKNRYSPIEKTIKQLEEKEWTRQKQSSTNGTRKNKEQPSQQKQ